MAAYNMVNPRVIQRERSLCSPNENPDVAREFAIAHQLAALRSGNPDAGRAYQGDEGQDRRFNVGALLGTLAIALAFAVLVLLGVLVWRERRQPQFSFHLPTPCAQLHAVFS